VPPERAGDTGFSLKVVTTTSASPKDAFAAFTQVAKWWDPEQTHSGDASHLNLIIKPGGALVEIIPGMGFARHLKLLYVNPGEEIRLFGGLGSLAPILYAVQVAQMGRHAAFSDSR
jgi:hypothetical protein